MESKSTTLNFKGQKVYVGIDVHLSNCKVSILLERLTHKTFSQDPDPGILAGYLKRNFPGAEYYSAYEAGFCGFSIHRTLESLGIHNIVVNPADIPTTDKERKQKEDKRDSRKIARSLRNGELQAIHVPSRELEELRGFVRYRKTLVKEISRHKTRIKSFLHFNGIEIPRELISASNHWSANFSKWLTTLRLTTSYGHSVITGTLDTVTHLRSILLKTNRQLRQIAKSETYNQPVNHLKSIPGVGLIVSMTLLSELGDINRFKSLGHLCSYIGLVPTTNSSGEKDHTGAITSRSNKPLRSVLIERAWIASRSDPALALAYHNLCKRMRPNRAVIRIAKKLLSRVRFVLKNQTEYAML